MVERLSKTIYITSKKVPPYIAFQSNVATSPHTLVGLDSECWNGKNEGTESAFVNRGRSGYPSGVGGG